MRRDARQPPALPDGRALRDPAGHHDAARAEDLTVTLGKVDKNDFEPSDERGATVDDVTTTTRCSGRGPRNDVALLTLASDAPAGLDPLRLIEPGESALWADGVTRRSSAGATRGHRSHRLPGLSDELLEATVPMRSDAYCGDRRVSDTDFRAASMVCAGGGEPETCRRLLRRAADGQRRFVAPARRGITSWGRTRARSPDLSWRLHATGAPALNAWLRERCRWRARACRTPSSSLADKRPCSGEQPADGTTQLRRGPRRRRRHRRDGANRQPRRPRFRLASWPASSRRRRDGQGPAAGRRRHHRRPRPDADADTTPTATTAATTTRPRRRRRSPHPAARSPRCSCRAARASAAGASPCACASRPARRPGPRSSRSSARAARSASRGREWSAVGHGGCA